MARLIATYAGVVTCMDSAISRLVGWGETERQLDNRVIMFRCDNGGSAEAGMAITPLSSMNRNIDNFVL